MVAGTGEPGRVLLGADCRGGAGTGEPGRCCWGQIAGAAQERECRGGAARRGAVEGKKNKGKHIFVQAFFNPEYLR